jgi:serine/threonine protein phosphatase 1
MSENENKLYFIGDIHGCVDTLKKMLNEIIIPNKNDTVVFLGDYIDRGKNSKGVLDELISYRKNKQFKSVFIRGNHDDMLLKSVYNPWLIPQWLKNGGNTTLADFNVKSPAQIDDEYINFLKSTRFYYTTDEYVAVHAGMNFKRNNPFDDNVSMLWKRNKEVHTDIINNRKLIVGHTPVSLKDAQKSISTNKIMLDGGCVYSKQLPHLGLLLCFDAKKKTIHYLRNIDE